MKAEGKESPFMVAFYWWRAAGRRPWRQAAALAVLIGLLGAVILGALAGAQRTATAYGRYLVASGVSDVFVNVSGRLPGLSLTAPITMISALPGVRSHATYIGLNGSPVINGHPDPAFMTAAINGSLDGEWFRQDRVTVVAGHLPPMTATDQIVLTRGVARLFHAGVGDRVTYSFQPVDPSGSSGGRPFSRSFRVAALAEVPPALVDQSDEVEGGVLPPGATRQLLAEYTYAWVGLRLTGGPAGIPALEAELPGLEAKLQREEVARTHQAAVLPSFGINRTDVVHRQVQQAIRPETVALGAVALAALAGLIILAGQGLAQLVTRSAPEVTVIRALGATRAQAALTAAGPGLIPVLGGSVLSVAGALALSPLAPVGPVARFDPDRGFRADWVILGPGALLLAGLLLVMLTVIATRLVWPRPARRPGTAPLLSRLAVQAGLPAVAVVGTRNAVEPGSGPAAVPVRSALLATVAAVTAVVAAITFDTSLAGLSSHPARYGWNSDVVIQSAGGYAPFKLKVLHRLLDGQPEVGAWSEYAFTQLAIDGRTVPVLGVQHQTGAVQPPTVSGQPATGPGQIQLGTQTLSELGKKVGDTVRLGSGAAARPVTITGTVTLPSFGLATADHVSLGRGALLPMATLAAAVGRGNGQAGGPSAVGAVFPSAVSIDLTPGTTPAQRDRLVRRIVAANPSYGPGYTYQLSQAQASAVVNAGHLRGQPLALALGIAAAAAISLALTVLGLVRRRRHELALLKTLGMTRTQVRGVVAWQTTLTLLIAAVLGGPLGVVAGRWGWRAFAGSLGVAPVTEVPLLAVFGLLAALILVGNLLAALPAAVAARTQPAVTLRTE
ncbi:MAG TPA: ABC transporter permease [Streptosporangiaceae bacterium]